MSNKILYLVRHAKSSWEHDVIDFERPLKNRGIEDANLISKHLINTIKTPDLIISSGAKRALTTAQIFIKNLEFQNLNFDIKDNIYDFSGELLLKEIKSCKNTINKLLVFGHNHALTNFANTYGSITIDNITTSGFVEIHFNTNSWENISIGKTKNVIFPKHLK